MSELGRASLWRWRLALWFYGNGNLLGCALALLGPLLRVAGVIGPGWLTITAGLYAGGYLLGGFSSTPRLAQNLSQTQLLEVLDDLVARSLPQLDGTTGGHLQQIRTSVAELLPRLSGEAASAGHEPALYTVQETVLRYLPDTLANYLALPPLFRTRHALADGKTAQQHLAAQLLQLDASLAEVLANLAARDAQALLANGRFLAAKFAAPDFKLGAN
jgi:hypothetical protein